MDRVKCSKVVWFLRTRKTQGVRKLSIPLHKYMRFTQVWTSLNVEEVIYLGIDNVRMQFGVCQARIG